MEKATNRKFDWVSNALMGALMVLTGIMIVFFPKAAMSMILIMAAIVFFVTGFTDMIAAIRYRNDSKGWQTTLSSGIVTLLVGAFMGVTIYMPVTPMTTVIVLCAWAVLRCLLTLVGVIMGKVRRSGTIISSSILGVSGILVFIFRDVLAASTLIIGYVLMGVGAVLMIIGFYRRAAVNERTEAIVQKEREEKKHEREEKLVSAINEKAHLRGLAEGYDTLSGEETSPEDGAEAGEEESAPSEEGEEASPAQAPEEEQGGKKSLREKLRDAAGIDAPATESEEPEHPEDGEAPAAREEEVPEQEGAEEVSEEGPSGEKAPDEDSPEEESAPREEEGESEEEKKGLRGFFSRF